MSLRFGRPAPEEAADFAALHVGCWREAYRGIVPDALLEGATVETRLGTWQRALADEKQIVIGVWDRAEPVAFIMAGKAEEVLFDGIDGHVRALYVRSSHYRRGLGNRLMAEATRAWLAQGGRTLSVGVLAANERARRFYEAMGGRLVKTGTYVWEGHPLEDAIYLYEDLAAMAGEDSAGAATPTSRDSSPR